MNDKNKHRLVFKVGTFSLVECSDGYWLYDYVIEMHIACRSKTEQDACIEALLYYQRKLTQVRKEYKDLRDKVENFVSQFTEEDW